MGASSWASTPAMTTAAFCRQGERETYAMTHSLCGARRSLASACRLEPPRHAEQHQVAEKVLLDVLGLHAVATRQTRELVVEADLQLLDGVRAAKDPDRAQG